MRYFINIFFLFISFLSFSQSWELKRSHNGIKVYTRKLDSTKIHEYKAVLTAHTTTKKALEIISDGNKLWEWNHKTSESKIVKKISNSEYVFWMKNDLPWPVKNRDNVVRVFISYLKENIIRLDLMPENSNLVPEKENCIRVTNFKGHWLIIPKPNNTVEIVQQLYGDPNGHLPVWLLNSMLTSAPYHSFYNLKQLLEK